MLSPLPALAALLLVLSGPAFAQAAPDAAITPLHTDLAARTYEAACASCHYRGAGKAPFNSRSPLGDARPDDLAQFILFGKAPEDDEPAMPGFGTGLTDADVTRLVVWLRSTAQPTAPWADVELSVQRVRASGQRAD